jgi:hypothetical protein
MFNTPYYHGIIRRVIVGFGTTFSHLKIIRPDSTGAVLQTVSVPIAYSPKEKWNVRVDQDPNLTQHVNTVIPRMSFEITGYNYDESRAINRNNRIEYKNGAVGKTVQAPVPYNLDISLYALTKGTEDGLAIVEQILPMFTPEYTLNLNALDSINVKQEVPLVLNSVTVQDDYKGDFLTKRLVTHTFNFTAKVNLYAGIIERSIITHTDVSLDTKVLNGNEMNHQSTGNPVTGAIIQDTWQ